MTTREEFESDSDRFNELLGKGILPSVALRKLETEKNIAAQRETEQRRLETEQRRSEAEAEKNRLKEEKKLITDSKLKKYQFQYTDRPADFKEAVIGDVKSSGGQFLGEGIGLLIGLFGIEYICIKIENAVIKSETSILTDFEKLLVNNAPKLLIYYLARRYTRYMDQGLPTGLVGGIGKAMPASIILDGYNRITNKRLLGDQQWVPLWTPLTDQQLQEIDNKLKN